MKFRTSSRKPLNLIPPALADREGQIWERLFDSAKILRIKIPFSQEQVNEAQKRLGRLLPYIRIPLDTGRGRYRPYRGVNMGNTNQAEPGSASTIEEALDKNKNATEEVKKVADDLLVVHTVLKEELAQDTRAEVVDRAVEQAGELEKRLNKSAEVLDAVNESLEQVAQGGDGSGGSDRSPPTQGAPRH